MTMNRCMDYTMAINAKPLVPSLESIVLSNCLQIPIDIILQQHPEANITLVNNKDIDDVDVGDNDNTIMKRCIVTDKQWLQDNIFCVLANALQDPSTNQVHIKVSSINKTMTVVNESSYHSKIMGDRRSSKEHLNDDIDLMDNVDFDDDNSLNCSSDIYNEYILFEIIVNGNSFSDEVKDLLFEPFSYDDIEGHKRVLGTGLGLFSLVNRIKALKGYYGISKYNSNNNNNDNDQVSEGNIIWFSIPYVKSISTILETSH